MNINSLRKGRNSIRSVLSILDFFESSNNLNIMCRGGLNWLYNSATAKQTDRNVRIHMTDNRHEKR